MRYSRHPTPIRSIHCRPAHQQHPATEAIDERLGRFNIEKVKQHGISQAGARLTADPIAVPSELGIKPAMHLIELRPKTLVGNGHADAHGVIAFGPFRG